MQLTKAEEELYYWQIGRAGSFSMGLFELIAKADGYNRRKLAQGFPDEVEAFNSYQNIPGYWEKIQEEMKG